MAKCAPLGHPAFRVNLKENCDDFLGALEALHGNADNGKLGWNEATSEAVKTQMVASQWR